jgi:anti-sigma B factor antagonist
VEAVDVRRHPRLDVRPAGDGRYALSGDLDITTAEELESVLDRDPASELTLDVAELRFLDSSGLRVLLKAVVRGRSLVLRSPTRSVARTLRIAGVDRLPGLSVVE